MTLELNKEWFDKRIHQDEEYEVGAGCPGLEAIQQTSECGQAEREDEEFAETFAFGTLIRFLRRDRRLKIEQLAANARVEVAELVKIELDPNYVPQPRSVHQLAAYFDLPQRALLKLSNVTMVHSTQLRDAAYRFAANASQISELSREERAAMTEFVEFLGSQDS
ncbi:MAG: helix-turn-helix transcriptional regulator [Pirellulales bacterium]|nr:helix-turn-helix transcriptional regulator [Pirellulales bacterium]